MNKKDQSLSFRLPDEGAEKLKVIIQEFGLSLDLITSEQEKWNRKAK